MTARDREEWVRVAETALRESPARTNERVARVIVDALIAAGHLGGDAALRAEVERLRGLVERGVALCARGRVINDQMERVAQQGGSGTPTQWAAEAYEVMLAEWQRDALAALAETEARDG